MSQPPARTSNLRIHRWLALLVALLLISSLGALFARDTSAAQPAPPVATPARVAGDAQRSPAISFIQSPSPTCYVAAPGSGACYIQWHYLYVEATPGSNIIA